MAAKINRVVYQFKVTLRGVQPPVWRRIQVWEDATLGQLHSILQIAMSREDCHLHQFKINQNVYSVPDPDDPFGAPGIINENRKKFCRMSSSALAHSSTIGTISATTGSISCCWRRSCCRNREHNIRAAWPANAAPRRKMWVDRPDTRITWKRWLIRSTNSTPVCCNGAGDLP
jgi:hypothetical protein